MIDSGGIGAGVSRQSFLMHAVASPWLRMLAGVLASAALLGLYASGGVYWPLGFVALIPWLWSLDERQSVSGMLASSWLMSVAFVLVVFPWFAAGVGAYTGIGTFMAMLVLMLAAPLLQAQLLVFALIRRWARTRHGPATGALAGGSAWVACEWLLPKLLGDTLGYGLAPSLLLRQLADVGGAAGLSLLLILINEALLDAGRQLRQRARAALVPLVAALLLLAGAFGYGSLRLAQLGAALAEPAPSIRVGMVQSGIVDYERLRAEIGAHAVVRQVLDTHFALSQAAIEQHGAEALLWSETVYPTPFGHPKSEAGAEFDGEIRAFVQDAGVPLVFGTYDVDAAGEYNAAAFLHPSRGLLGYYRKTHPFPLTEYVPPWLDGPLLRRLLPWAGGWSPGDGPRVFPLQVADGRSLDVLPLICLDSVRPGLSIAGARQGAQAILGLSNDSWFTLQPQGARLHLAVASFRSIETRLPQLRVTSNGLSAFIDESGEVLVQTGMGDQAVLVGALPLRDPQPTLMLRWGDWVGRAGLGFLLALVLSALGHRALRAAELRKSGQEARASAGEFETRVALLTPAWRWLIAGLRVAAALALLWLGLSMLLFEGLQVQSLAQLRWFAAAVLAPLLAAWALQSMFTAQLRINGGRLLLESASQRIEVPLRELRELRIWRLPLPSGGGSLQLADAPWPTAVALQDPRGLRRALLAAGAPLVDSRPRPSLLEAVLAYRAAARRPWLDHALFKFGLFPLVPALPAFRLHQYIAFGGTFGELLTFGAKAWLLGLGIWWLSWSLGLMLFAALLRALIEPLNLACLALRPALGFSVRHWLEWLGRLLFYLGIPLWLLLRLLA
ncbi:MAG: apolipoprotein N-acyltransferase [Aquimonas sp.]|nr:apolipoprotein N-acyltransferase [Aquimonas sp.]